MGYLVVLLSILLPVLQVEIESTSLLILGIISLVAGLVILVAPHVLNYIVAAYLIVIGVLWIISAL